MYRDPGSGIRDPGSNDIHRHAACDAKSTQENGEQRSKTKNNFLFSFLLSPVFSRCDRSGTVNVVD